MECTENSSSNYSSIAHKALSGMEALFGSLAWRHTISSPGSLVSLAKIKSWAVTGMWILCPGAICEDTPA